MKTEINQEDVSDDLKNYYIKLQMDTGLTVGYYMYPH